MKIAKLVLLMTLAIGAGPSYAGFVDSRATDAVIEVHYKSVSLEDLISEIAPREYVVEYSKPEQRKTMVAINDKGTWSHLLRQAAATSNLAVYVDNSAQSIKFAERVAMVSRAPETTPAQAVGSAPATGSAVSPTLRLAGAAGAAPPYVASVAPAAGKPATVAAPPVSARPVQTISPAAFTTTSSDYQVSAVLQRWAAQANMQYVWEPRNVEFLISAENDWGTDLRQAVRDLLMSVQAGQSAQAGRESVRACIHPNKPKNVLRIIRFNERCAGAM